MARVMLRRGKKEHRGGHERGQGQGQTHRPSPAGCGEKIPLDEVIQQSGVHLHPG